MADIKIYNPESLGAPLGQYSHVTRVKAGELLFIAGMLASTAFGLFPKMLPASTDPARSLTAYNSAAGAYGLEVGLVWWIVGMALAAGYFIYMYRSFRGKVLPGHNEGGY